MSAARQDTLSPTTWPQTISPERPLLVPEEVGFVDTDLQARLKKVHCTSSCTVTSAPSNSSKTTHETTPGHKRSSPKGCRRVKGETRRNHRFWRRLAFGPRPNESIAPKTGLRVRVPTLGA